MNQIIDGKKYDTTKATLLASDRYWDGHNWERNGRNTYLYRTAKGRYFLHHETMWQGEFSSIQTISEEEAAEFYEELRLGQEVPFEEAFPDRVLEEA